MADPRVKVSILVETLREVPARHIVGLGKPHHVALETFTNGAATAWCACGFQSYTCTGHVLGLTPPACAEGDVRRHAQTMNARAALLARTQRVKETTDED